MNNKKIIAISALVLLLVVLIVLKNNDDVKDILSVSRPEETTGEPEFMTGGGNLVVQSEDNMLIDAESVYNVIGDSATDTKSHEYKHISIQDDLTPLVQEDGKIQLKENSMDQYVIPDKYSTGCQIADSQLLAYTGDGTYNGIKVYKDSSGRVAMDVYTHNANQEYYVTGVDFGTEPFAEVRGDKASAKTIVFENCKMGRVTLSPTSKVTYKFINCTMVGFIGSNTELINCKLGGTCKDAANPYQNVTFTNCYIQDLASQYYDSGEVHSDGTQMYGKENVDIKNVVFENCRFEVPSNGSSTSAATVNACFFVQPEYADAYDVSFIRGYVNGGTYALRWGYKNDRKIYNLTMSDIKVGAACQYGYYHGYQSDEITVSNIQSADVLYVGSVWNSSDGKHISVTNDTPKERKLQVFTEAGVSTYTIPACPTYSEYCNGQIAFSEMPFDIDIAVGNSSWVACYDITESKAKQIRYVNDKGNTIYIDASTINNSSVQTVASGQCGKKVNWTLDSDGVLTISGTGAMYNYHSQLTPEYAAYAKLITAVRVEEGVTMIGNQAFRALVFTDTIYLPTTIETIGNRVFDKMPLTRCNYKGTVDQWNKVSIWAYNDYLTYYAYIVVEYKEVAESVIPDAVKTITAQGTYSDTVFWNLYEDGTLEVSGEGSTNNYHSLSLSPTYEFRDKIIRIEIKEGITKIGNQTFWNLPNVKEVELPKSLTYVGQSAFHKCAAIINVYYAGTEEDWGLITWLGYNNYVRYGNVILTETEDEGKSEEENETEEVVELVSKGSYSDTVFWYLYEDGTLEVSGEGVTDNYHSAKLSPTYEYVDMIEKIVIKEGVTTLGNQLFWNLKNVKEVTIPKSVTYVGKSAFHKCAAIENIYYAGSKSDWELIDWLGYNTYVLQGNVIYEIQ